MYGLLDMILFSESTDYPLEGWVWLMWGFTLL